MHELFTQPLGATNGPLARVDVRVKLIAALALIAAVVLSSRPILPLAALVGCAAGGRAFKLRLRTLARRLAAPVALVAVIVLLRAVMTGSTPLVRLSLSAGR